MPFDKSTAIRDLIAATRKSDHTGFIPVVFNGREPRVIGWARTHSEADACAIHARVSAQFVSRAQVQLTDGTMSDPFFVMHG